MDEASRAANWKDVRLITVIFNLGGAFFAFVAGIRRAEPAILHGSIVWLVGLALLLVLAAGGAAAHFGGWYGGLGGMSATATAVPSAEGTAAAMRNTALTTVVAVLLGLVGSVIGGWMGSGEPMSVTYYRRRDVTRPIEEERARRVA